MADFLNIQLSLPRKTNFSRKMRKNVGWRIKSVCKFAPDSVNAENAVFLPGKMPLSAFLHVWHFFRWFFGKRGKGKWTMASWPHPGIRPHHRRRCRRRHGEISRERACSPKSTASLQFTGLVTHSHTPRAQCSAIMGTQRRKGRPFQFYSLLSLFPLFRFQVLAPHYRTNVFICVWEGGK